MKKLALAVAFAVAAIAPTIASADVPGAHPAYLHAISNLREARALLRRPSGLQVKWDENMAIREIDAALHEIKDAAIDDGKPLDFAPPIDTNLQWGGRLHRALELVDAAHADVDQHESNDYARDLKHRALRHIDLADGMIKQGIIDAESAGPVAGPHPAYIHAIQNLRYARALIARPANFQTQWDEQVAVREIDAALREVKTAAIDDGKDIGEHPPVNLGDDWGGRLQKAVELLQQAHADVDQHESNEFARDLKHRALAHIDAATNATLQGIAAAHPQHPAYLHALQDLRYARALLRRPTRHLELKWSEDEAIREIDGAIREIKEAAIDDGKNVDDHPPVDIEGDYRGRLSQARDLVQRARDDIHQREDNAFGRGLRDRANSHLKYAVEAINAGINGLQ